MATGSRAPRHLGARLLAGRSSSSGGGGVVVAGGVGGEATGGGGGTASTVLLTAHHGDDVVEGLELGSAGGDTVGVSDEIRPKLGAHEGAVERGGTRTTAVVAS